MEPIKFTPIQTEIIDGIMLGDGYLCRSGKRSASLQLEQAIHHKDWVEKVKPMLNLTNTKVETRWKTATNGAKGNKTLCYRIRKGNSAFYDFWERFYLTKEDFKNQYNYFSTKNKTQAKVIPADIKLTPTVLLHWYYGDGTLYSKNRPALCTQGFPKSNLEDVLIPKLRELGLEAELRFDNGGQYEEDNHGYMIIINSESGAKFFELIGPCTMNGFQHKWS